MPTQAKVEAVESLKARLSGVKTAVLTEYRGLTVQQLSDLRRQLRSAAAEYTVVKNRLAKRAVQGSPLEGLRSHLKGPTGLVISKQDPVALAKALQAFVKTNPLLQIKLGYVDGRLLQPPELRVMADLPSRGVLLGQVVGALQAPIAHVVHSLDGMLRSLVSVLDQVRAKRETTGS
ncbi:MAG: 50S ribosomal protein L10 [Candidatus Rokubacteria bacterium]|nr:50S ribosomal protein L10 [Candidatus Rokubacteria bacterium]